MAAGARIIIMKYISLILILIVGCHSPRTLKPRAKPAKATAEQLAKYDYAIYNYIANVSQQEALK